MVVMTTTTMNGKLDLLDEMSDTLAAPRTKTSPPARTFSSKVAARARPARMASAAPRSTAPRHWKVSLEIAGDSLVRRLLGFTLFLAATAALAWLAFIMLQFLFAWSHLVTWVRTTMI